MPQTRRSQLLIFSLVGILLISENRKYGPTNKKQNDLGNVSLIWEGCGLHSIKTNNSGVYFKKRKVHT